MKVLEKSLREMSQDELVRFADGLKLNLSAPTPAAYSARGAGGCRQPGVAALQFATVAAVGVIEAMGGIATRGTLFAANRALGYWPVDRDCTELRLADS